MKYIHQKSRILNTTLALVGLGIFAATNTSRAAVTIFFEQVGADVRVSAQGTLDIQPTVPTGPATDTVSFVASTQVRDIAASDRYVLSAGSATPTPLLSINVGVSPTGDGAFGFLNERLQVDPTDISGGTLGTAVTQITWSPIDDFFIMPGETLAAIGADNLQNALAWTATGTGDTIVLQTIPEPAGAALVALGGCALFARRRRPGRGR